MKLQGLKIAISASDAPDRARLGLPEHEVDRVVLTLCTTIVREGAEVLYAGNLAPDQYTFKIFRHLAGAYASRSATPPFQHIVPEPIARRSGFDALHAALRENVAVAQTRICIGGHLVRVRASNAALLIGEANPGRRTVEDEAGWEAWLASHPVIDPYTAYTVARAAVTAEADARIAIGGKLGVTDNAADRYEGAIPGIFEEAIMTLEADKPLIALGAYGGAARDLAIALEVLDRGERVPRGDQQDGYAEAVDRAAALGRRIPDAVRPALSALANDDRAEAISHAVVEAVLSWRGATGPIA
ncbi:MAG: hypothetical protein V4514_01725 [Pseudomonadota bacterium]|uniref:hypothetical protein n=1 Tax=Phenylobacterium sp. TaxID=1871053 RepID=UPI0025DBE6D1|nr:hypothetical protein [Phenylobacterium sp.]MBT9473844.1 hypothetical protein [Phenylobacterium sp.]